jgi:hypothetical protein
VKKEINITVTVDVPEGNALVSQEVLDDLNAAIREVKGQHNTLPLTEGYMVVDTTWKRALTFHNDKWLGTSSTTIPITVFNTVKEAQQAIQKTIAHGGGNKYAWQSNNYVVIGVHKYNRPLRSTASVGTKKK